MRKDGFFQPVSALEMPRFAGMPSFMRLPHLTLESQEISRVDIGLVGVPWDAGTTNRPGPRHGPRQLRDLSTMIRSLNPVTGINPFELVNCLISVMLALTRLICRIVWTASWHFMLN